MAALQALHHAYGAWTTWSILRYDSDILVMGVRCFHDGKLMHEVTFADVDYINMPTQWSDDFTVEEAEMPLKNWEMGSPRYARFAMEDELEFGLTFRKIAISDVDASCPHRKQPEARSAPPRC